MGNPYISAGAKLAYGLEPSFGTAAADLTKVLGHFRANVDMPDARTEVKKYWTFGIGRQGHKRLMPGPITRPGKLPLVVTNGAIFALLFGEETVTPDTPSVGINEHALTHATKAILPSMTLGCHLSSDSGSRDFMRSFLGTVVEEANFTVAQGEALHADIGIMSKTVRDHTTATAGSWVDDISGLEVNGFTDDTGRPYMWHDSKITLATYDSGTDSYNTALAMSRIERLTFGVKNNHNTKRYLVDGEGREPFEYLTKRPSYTYGMDFVPAGYLASHTGTLTYSDGSETTREAVYDILESELPVNIVVRLRKAGATDDAIEFTFSDCILSEAGHPLDIGGGEVKVPIRIEPRLINVKVYDELAAYLP